MKTRLMSIVAIVMVSACASKSYFKVDEKAFYLADNSNTCQVVSSLHDIKLDLLIPWPCQVHKDTSDKIRVYRESGKKYFLVESSIPHPELPNDCITQLQAVMIFEGGVKQSEFKDTVASCPPFQWDIKIFTGLFKDE